MTVVGLVLLKLILKGLIAFAYWKHIRNITIIPNVHLKIKYDIVLINGLLQSLENTTLERGWQSFISHAFYFCLIPSLEHIPLHQVRERCRPISQEFSNSALITCIKNYRWDGYTEYYKLYNYYKCVILGQICRQLVWDIALCMLELEEWGRMLKAGMKHASSLIYLRNFYK